MSMRKEPWPQGTPCWVDLMTTDQAAAKQFYTSLFGWQVIDTGEEMGHYGMCEVGGQPVAGIGASQDAHPNWTTYLAAEDIDKTAEAIATAGGTVVMGPTAVGEEGKMAIAQDPTGAFFGVWQAGRHIGARLVNEKGGFVWNECVTRDPQRAREFYAAVFGYTYTQMEGEADYTTINGSGPGNTIGGLGLLNKDLPAEVPPHWMTYFVVDDADAAADTVRAGGGQVQMGPFDTPFGRMAVIRDPQGAVFSIMEDTSGGDTANA
jgi:uncharacterized protein